MYRLYGKRAGANWEHPKATNKPSKKEIEATLKYLQDLANNDTNQDWIN